MFAIPPAFLPAASGNGDSFYNSTVLLLHMNGTNGGTTFTDNSFVGRVTAAGGNAQTSTAQSIFNGSSGLFDGSGDFISCGVSADFDFGSGDFTIEGAIRANTLSGIDALVSNRQTAGADPGFILYVNGGVLNFVAWNPAGTVVVNFAGPTFTTGSWQWFAVRRLTNTFTLWKDGANTGSASYSGAIAASAPLALTTFVGKDPSTAGREYDGHMAELRITKGVGRTIVVPTSPWPNSL